MHSASLGHFWGSEASRNDPEPYGFVLFQYEAMLEANVPISDEIPWNSRFQDFPIPRFLWGMLRAVSFTGKMVPGISGSRP